MKFDCIIRAAAAGAAILILAGCSSEGEDYYARARSALESGNESLARTMLLHEIAANDTPEAHLQYAKLCGNTHANAALAAWHYRRYLELVPESPEAKEVARLAEACEQQFSDAFIQARTNREYSSLEEIQDRMRMIEEQSKRQKRWVEQLENDRKSLNSQILELRNATAKPRPGHDD